MTYPKISLKHGESRVWIYADGNEIGNLKLNLDSDVVERYPYDNNLVELVHDVYGQVVRHKR